MELELQTATGALLEQHDRTSWISQQYHDLNTSIVRRRQEDQDYLITWINDEEVTELQNMVLAAAAPTDSITTVTVNHYPQTFKWILKEVTDQINRIEPGICPFSGNDLEDGDWDCRDAAENLRQILVANPQVREEIRKQLNYQQYCALLIALEPQYSIVRNTADLMNSKGAFFITDENQQPQLILNTPYTKTNGTEDYGIPEENLLNTLIFIQQYDLKPITISLNASIGGHNTHIVIHRAENGKFVISSADSLRANQQATQNSIVAQATRLIKNVFPTSAGKAPEIITINQNVIQWQGEACCGFHAGLNSGFLLDFQAIHSALEHANSSKERNFNYTSLDYNKEQFEKVRELRDRIFDGNGATVRRKNGQYRELDLSDFNNTAIEIANGQFTPSKTRNDLVEEQLIYDTNNYARDTFTQPSTELQADDSQRLLEQIELQVQYNLQQLLGADTNKNSNGNLFADSYEDQDEEVINHFNEIVNHLLDLEEEIQKSQTESTDKITSISQSEQPAVNNIIDPMPMLSSFNQNQDILPMEDIKSSNLTDQNPDSLDASQNYQMIEKPTILDKPVIGMAKKFCAAAHKIKAQVIDKIKEMAMPSA